MEPEELNLYWRGNSIKCIHNIDNQLFEFEKNIFIEYNDEFDWFQSNYNCINAIGDSMQESLDNLAIAIDSIKALELP